MMRLPGVTAAVLVLAALAMGGGCAEYQVTATRLPVEWSAPPTENMEAIDLSRLSHYTTNSELIDRGDVLEVSIVTNYSTVAATTFPVRVSDNGMADIPLIGQVAVGGLETEAAEQAIAAAAIGRGIYQKPHVIVSMKRQRSNRVTVIGAVKQPGVYSLPRGSSSLLAALVTAGGLTEEAGTDVELRHPQAALQGPLPMPRAGEAGQDAAGPLSPVVRVNLAQAAARGDSLFPIYDGDVVVVGKRAPKPVFVMGLVQKPGEYKMPPNHNLHVLDALALAGDRRTQLADKVTVIRHVPGREQPVVVGVSVREAKHNGAANLRLAPGDIVTVEETPLTAAAKAFTDVFRFTVGGAVSVF